MPGCVIRSTARARAGESEREILRSEAGAAQLDSVRPVLSAADVIGIQDEVTRVRVDD